MRSTKILNRRLTSESGVAIVESAMILILLFMLLVGIIEFSILVYNKSTITHGAREAARFATLFNVDAAGDFSYSPMTDAEIQAFVNMHLAGLVSFSSAATPPTVTVTPDWATRQADRSDTPVVVTVDYNYSFILTPGDVDLQAQAVMRPE